MTSTSFLLILIGLFVIINVVNFVGVFKGDIKIGSTSTPDGTKAEVRSSSTVSSGGGSSGHSVGSSY